MVSSTVSRYRDCVQLGAWAHPLSIPPRFVEPYLVSSHASHVTLPIVFTAGKCMYSSILSLPYVILLILCCSFPCAVYQYYCHFIPPPLSPRPFYAISAPSLSPHLSIGCLLVFPDGKCMYDSILSLPLCYTLADMKRSEHF